MGSSVDGLSSGLNTTSMITQMMQVEAAPQTKLKTKVETAQNVITSYQTVNAKLKATKSAADSLGSLGSWRALKTTSSSSSVTATAAGGLAGMTGSVKFDVSSVARSQTTVLKVADTTAEGTFPTSIMVQPGSWSTDGNGVEQFTAVGDPVEVTIPEPRKADSLTSAMNSATDANGVSLGIRAYTVTTSGSEGVVQFAGMKSGSANGFQIAGLENSGTGGTGPESTSAKDAVLTMNPGTAAEYKVTSATNTFSALMPGVTISVSKQETGVTIDAASDSKAISDKVQALVDAANAALSEIKTQTAYDPDTRTGSPLTGDFTVRQMNQAVLSLISGGLSYDKSVTANNTPTTETVNFGSLNQLGISLSRDGQLSFDSTAFAKAYADDPGKIQEAGMAFGSQVRALSDKQSITVTNVITGRKNEIDSLNEQIDNWDVRLSLRKEALQRQYAALETSLGTLKNQSSWLSGQLAGL
ncbi:flagellar filament capping protein FliD [Actinoplanes derwentensis]|uniref:Flagellar hook-associated protein 2 n=1 Tax=Actinoplanes derwentensis TaxID=113562 RepID=A0A1H2CZG3_9ACTN|nr:flagellar filament capping protein FliD [Actinoplanes derwentensis]GID86639.1 flagellar hook-associated protein 2 [Actinoplanes derwentensis]SDT75920.1 flagellar hook-associated protein 2 [Actinoplanes derwentensis]